MPRLSQETLAILGVGICRRWIVVARGRHELVFLCRISAALIRPTRSGLTMRQGTVEHEVTPATGAMPCDEERYGFNLSYLIGAGPGGGNAFVQFGDRDSEDDARDTDYWVFGYSYYASESVTVNLAHRIQKAYDTGVEVKTNTSVVALKVDF